MDSEQTSVAKRPDHKIPMRLGGLITLVLGLLSLQNGLGAMLTGEEFPFGPYVTRVAACGMIVIIFGIIAIAGGVSALRGKHFSLALAGTLLGMMGGGLVAFLLGLVACVLFYFADEDF